MGRFAVDDSRVRPPLQLRFGRAIFGIACIGLGLMGLLDVDDSGTAWIWATLFGSFGVAGLVTVVEDIALRLRR